MNTAVLHTTGTLRSKVLAAFSYLGVLCFVPLIINGEDEFVYFHAKQGLVIWMWGVLAAFALVVPGIGKVFFSFSMLAVLVLSIVGLVSVMLDKAWRLPIVYSLASKI